MNEVIDCELQKLMRNNQVLLTKRQKAYLKLKRLLDFLCAFVALVVLSPVFLILAIVIKLDSPKDPILFKQERVGQNSKIFTLYKFRSMKQGTPELGTNEFVNAEQYITRVGKLLRKTSLDELPQLYSVLIGDMSLIGERPLIVREEEVHFLRTYYGIYQLKPGITGLAQINGRDNMSDYDKVRWDRTYAYNLSFELDVKILWQTVRKVIKSEGIIDGFAQKQSMISEGEYQKTNLVYNDDIQISSTKRDAEEVV